jgi:predicted ATP-grasp superfamily ATP-dependent carboligase
MPDSEGVTRLIKTLNGVYDTDVNPETLLEKAEETKKENP